MFCAKENKKIKKQIKDQINTLFEHLDKNLEKIWYNLKSASSKFF